MPFFVRRPRLRLGLLTLCIFLVASVVIDLLRTWSPQPTSNSERNASIGKVSMLYGDYEPAFERALQLHTPHNERFGYPMFILRKQTLPDYWSKPAFILTILLKELEKPETERLKWLFWVDADVVLMNSQIPLEIFLPNDELWPDIHCLVTKDHHGLNNGVFFLRVHEWSVWLMSAVVATKVFQPDVELRFGDQSALEILLNTDAFKSQTRYVPQRWFNAYQGKRGDGDSDPNLPMDYVRPFWVTEGSLHVHFPAHRRYRWRRMMLWMNTAETHTAPWEVSVNDTTYMSEIREYWEKEVVNHNMLIEAEQQKDKEMAEKAQVLAEAEGLPAWDEKTENEEVEKVEQRVASDQSFMPAGKG